jgi:ribosomal protein S24E
MELKILEEKENSLFNRKEIKARAVSKAAPSREEVLTLLSEKTKLPKENIKIKGIRGSFGVNEFDIEANLYSSKEEKEKIEIVKKKEKEAAKPKEPEQPAEKSEEKPAEKSGENTKEQKPDVAPAQEQSEEKIEEEEKNEKEKELGKPE